MKFKPLFLVVLWIVYRIHIVDGLFVRNLYVFEKVPWSMTTTTTLPQTTPTTKTPTSLGSSSSSIIDFQSDESRYGRGEYHLSAALEEGDVVVFRCGSWFVDGVLVGDEDKTEFRLAVVDSIQVVWTHNCEHGVVRAIAASLDDDNQTIQVDESEFLEFGPEQLVAKLPVGKDGKSKILLDPSLWEEPV